MSEALTDAQLLALAHNAGFTGDAAVQAAAVAKAESGGRPDAQNSTGNYPETSRDRGVLQFNSFWHPEVSDECAFDPACAFREAYRVSNGGSNFGAWVATGTDRFQSILADLRGADSGTTDVGTTPTVVGPSGSGFIPQLDLPVLPTDAANRATAGGANQSPDARSRNATASGNAGSLNPFDGVAKAIDNLGAAITKPVTDVENAFHRAVWTAAFVGLGVLMIGAGLLLYLRAPIAREGERAEKIAVRAAA